MTKNLNSHVTVTDINEIIAIKLVECFWELSERLHVSCSVKINQSLDTPVKCIGFVSIDYDRTSNLMTRIDLVAVWTTNDLLLSTNFVTAVDFIVSTEFWPVGQGRW